MQTLEEYIAMKRKQKEILLMTHIVIGYPSFDDSFRIVEEMVKSGVDIIELQIPFSEPIADGPVILNANQVALRNGSTVQKCLDFAGKVTAQFDIPFLFMTYFNILFKYGIPEFASRMAEKKLRGAIVPDLPLEEADEYLASMKKAGLAPVFIYSPQSREERMKKIAAHAKGFVYCVARKGVTGKNTDFSGQLTSYLADCRKNAGIPIALGFGVKDKTDVDFLKGKADIAVIGTQTIRIIEDKGIGAAGEFLRSLQG